MNNVRKTALVISGGGAKGAFAVGVVKSLYARFCQQGWFSIIGGTSTGALISPLAALMAAPDSMGSEAHDTLVSMYTNVTTSDILERQNIFELIGRQDCLNESDPLKDLIYTTLHKDWFDWLQTADAPDCYVVYTNYQNGQKVTVSPKDENITRDLFIRAMLASASVPVVMEATNINGDVCYDGGVRDLLPFGEAIHLGADTIIPVFLDPEDFGYTSSRFRRLDKILLRTLAIMVDETGRNDFEMANLVNVGIRAKQDILKQFSGDVASLKKLNKVFDNAEYKDLFGSEKHLVNIIGGLRPDQSLTEDSLSFEPAKMRLWVEWGEKKATEIVHENPFA